MTKAAQFVYYGASENEKRVVRFFKDNGMYKCTIEGMPALTITHPSYERVKAAFEGWYQMAFKDWGPSEIDWGDMQSRIEEGGS